MTAVNREDTAQAVGGVLPDGDKPEPQRPRPASTARLAAVASNRAAQAGLVAALGLTLRLIGVRRSYDIFIDEVTYTRLAVNLAGGRGLTLDGHPFDLHPPGMIAVLALVLKVFSLHGPLEHQVLALRPVASVFGALSCAGAYLLTERASNRRYALMVAALVALNPLVVLYDSQVMLEAMAQAAVVAMVWLLAAATWSPSAAGRNRLAIAAGAGGAVVVCTKETFGLVAVAVLLVLLVTKWVLPRRQVVLTLAVTAAGYAVYVVSVGLAMGFGAWWTAQSGGVLRLVGIDQVTGFNAANVHVSLLSRAFADGPTDGVTYALLLLGGLASVAVLWRARPWAPGWRRTSGPRERTGALIAIWSLCASAYLAYAVGFGTLEEQMFYIMVLPTTASLGVWAFGRAGSWRPNWRRLAAGLLVVGLAAEGAVWGVVHTRDDNTYREFLAWEPTHVPFGSTISVTEGTAQFLVGGAVLGDWTTLVELRAHHVGYVLLSTTLVDQGYGSATRSFEALLNREGRIVFEAHGSSTGSLRLYDVQALVRGTP